VRYGKRLHKISVVGGLIIPVASVQLIVEDSAASTNRGFSGSERIPCETDAGREIGFGCDERRTRLIHRIGGLQMRTHHSINFDRAGPRFPTQAEIYGQIGTYFPVILNK